MKKNIAVIISAVLIIIVAFFVFLSKKTLSSVSVKNFKECAARGYPVIETFPRQCRTPDKRVFSEEDDTETAKRYSIEIDTPRPSQVISSPIIISGKARGSWFFEASFPVRLIDANDVPIATVAAEAKSDWMTTDFVPFTARLEFKNPGSKTGTLILVKDNPSGLSEHAEEIRIPVVFKNVNFATTSANANF